jgi:hypothetical protein
MAVTYCGGELPLAGVKARCEEPSHSTTKLKDIKLKKHSTLSLETGCQ